MKFDGVDELSANFKAHAKNYVGYDEPNESDDRNDRDNLVIEGMLVSSNMKFSPATMKQVCTDAGVQWLGSNIGFLLEW
jgi:hypothetical protein